MADTDLLLTSTPTEEYLTVADETTEDSMSTSDVTLSSIVSDETRDRISFSPEQTTENINELNEPETSLITFEAAETTETFDATTDEKSFMSRVSFSDTTPLYSEFELKSADDQVLTSPSNLDETSFAALDETTDSVESFTESLSTNPPVETLSSFASVTTDDNAYSESDTTNLPTDVQDGCSSNVAETTDKISSEHPNDEGYMKTSSVNIKEKTTKSTTLNVQPETEIKEPLPIAIYLLLGILAFCTMSVVIIVIYNLRKIKSKDQDLSFNKPDVEWPQQQPQPERESRLYRYTIEMDELHKFSLENVKAQVTTFNAASGQKFEQKSNSGSFQSLVIHDNSSCSNHDDDEQNSVEIRETPAKNHRIIVFHDSFVLQNETQPNDDKLQTEL